VAFFGRETPVEQLGPADWRKFRAHLAEKYNPVAMKNRMIVVRTMFNHAFANRLIKTPMHYGTEFSLPEEKTIRRVENERGDQSLKPAEIEALIAAAKQPMRAMIMLAINGGLGPTDLALLTADKLDLAGGWLDYPRPKTEQPRRVPLWPETVAAIQEAIYQRRQPKNAADAALLFIGARGTSYVNRTGGHHLAHEFTRLCEKAKVTGHVFYDLRRTFETVADNLSRDRDGVAAIMGHVPKGDDMAAKYRQSWFEERLRGIVQHVHGWLYAEEAKAPQKRTRKAPAADMPLRIVG
jgi:integrase